MRLQDEFAAIQAAADKQKTRDTAAQVAKEYNLPDSDAEVLLAYSEDERLMRVMAKRLERDRPFTPEEQVRLANGLAHAKNSRAAEHLRKLGSANPLSR